MLADTDYLLELIKTIQAQMEKQASEESVLLMRASIIDTNRRLDALSNILLMRIEELSKQQRELAEQHERNTQTRLRRTITIQTSILLTALTAIIGIMLNYVFRFLK